jgi:hypothetical protein
MINEINDYLAKNKKQFFSMMNSHWGKNDDDTKKLKFLWNKAQEASGVNNKIRAFEDLKGAMKPFIKPQRLAANEKILEDNNIEKFGDAGDQMTLEMDRMFDALSNFPEASKLEDLNIEEAFSQGYDFDQMKTLAKKYNFDYTDPKDRVEFLNLLSNIEQQRLKNEAYSPKDAAGALTQIAFPVALNYARNNEDKIRTDGPSIDGVPLKGAWDMKWPLAVDAASQVAMAGGAPIGKAALSPISEKAGEVVGGMIAAPLITEAGQAVLNKKPIPDAAADAGVGVATNAFAPGGIKGMFNTFDAPFRWGEKGSARQAANKFVDELETIIRKQRSGTPYRHLENVSDRVVAKFDAKKAKALENNEVFDVNAAWKESEKEAYKELLDEYAANVRLTGKTDVFKERPFRKTKELTPKEVLDDESSILNITTDDDYKRNLVYNWRKNHPTETSVLDDTFKKEAAIKKINNEPWTAPDLVNANITETPIHAAGRLFGRYSEPLSSLGMNLGATTRLTDRRLGLMDRYLNLPWKYGEKDKKDIDFNKPEVKAYMKAYSRYNANKNYLNEPPKPKGYSAEEVDKIKKAAELLNINSVFGE